MTSLKNPLIRDVLESLPFYTASLSGNLLEGMPVSFTTRPLHLLQDLPIIYQWVNQDYAVPFWQMNGSYQSLFDTYEAIRSSSHCESLIGCLDQQPVCQVDIYDPSRDIIQPYYAWQAGDIGFHLLMAPGKRPFSNSTAKIVRLFLQLFFHGGAVKRVVGEPDARNEKANRLLQTLLFQFVDQLLLPHKTACFYTLTKGQYNSATASLSL